MKVRNRIRSAGMALIILFVLGCSRKDSGEVSRSVSSFSGSAVAAGYSVPELASYRIAYYEAQAAADTETEAGLIQESDDPFTVTDFGPLGELPHEIKNPSIYAVFSQPVVPLAKLGEPIREDAGVFTIDPPLKGVYRWYGSKLLSFEPDEAVLPQHRYTVTVSDRLRSLGGKGLEGERSFTFETERLSVLSWQLGDPETWVNIRSAHPDDARYITVVFSYPVELDEIAKWIEIRGNRQNWPFTLSRPEKTGSRRISSPEQAVLITMDQAPPVDTDMEVTVRKGARSREGWLGSHEPARYSFHTLRPFAYERISARTSASPRTLQGSSIPVLVDFNYAVDEKDIERYFSIEGIPPIKRENVKVYGSRVVLNELPLNYERSYWVNISGNVTDIMGRSLGQDRRVQINVGTANSYVHIQDRGSRMLEAAFPPRYAWETQNPLSVSRTIQSVSSPYVRAPASSLSAVDLSVIPKNQKYYFVDDLAPYLGPGGRGTVAMRWMYRYPSAWQPGRIENGDVWLTLQVTDLGITLRYAYNKVLVWVTRISTGEPVPGAGIELLEGDTSLRRTAADASGLGVFEMAPGELVSLFTNPSPSASVGDRMGIGFRVKVTENGGAMAGGDEAEFIPNSSHNLWRFRVEGTVSPFDAEKGRSLVFLFTDRGLYRPGETVTFRGIDRDIVLGEHQAYVGPYSIEVSTGAYQAPVIARVSGSTTKNGGSYGTFGIPRDLDPGTYTIRYTRGSVSRNVTFVVANFERLRFESSLSFLGRSFSAGEPVSAQLKASYLAGGAMSGAPYTYFWTREPVGFNPGGVWTYWRFGPEFYGYRETLSRGEGTLGPDGSASIIQASPSGGVEGVPHQFRVEASVQDAARQEISSRASVLVHPSSFYIASRLDSGNTAPAPGSISRPPARILKAGSSATLSWALVTPEGNYFSAPSGWDGEVSLQLIRYEWKTTRQAGVGGRVNLVWERVEKVVEEKTADLSSIRGNLSGTLRFTPDQSGQWEIRIRSKDQQDRPVFTRYGFYVSGAGWVRWGSDDADSISLTTDKTEYVPGETATILIRSPLPKGKYLLTLEREGIISEKIIELDGSAETITVPIEESFVPIVYVALSSYTVRSGPPENTYYEPDLDKPKGLFGLTALYVDHTSRHYTVDIEPLKGAYGPGEEASVRLSVNLNGRPVPGAELSFMAVDRGVVDLIDYHVPDPLAFFYNPSNYPLGVRGADSRSLLIDPVTYSLSDLQGGDSEDESKLEERKDFRPTAVFEPFLVTGADGTVTVRFSLPDSLTTYRCTAVAVGADRYGIREQDLRVSAPLVATMALPRKLRWRDTGTVSLILTNLDKAAAEATVSLDIGPEENSAELTEASLVVDGEVSKTVTVGPGESREVSFRVAAVGSGTSRLTFTLRSPLVNERITRPLTVDRPVLFETVSTIGSLGIDDTAAEEGIVLPSAIPEGTGSFSLVLAASRLAQLQEAVQYLLEYPYGCLEQRTAWLVPIVAFGPHLSAFGLETPITDVRKTVEDELALIAKNQLPDGSYPYWPGGQYGSFYVTLRVAHIAHLAKEKGYSVPAAMNTRQMLNYLTNSDYAKRYAGRDPFLEGYLLWVRAMYRENVGSEIDNFLKRGDTLGISGYGFAGLAALELNMKSTAVSARDKIKRFIRPGTRTLDITDTYERGENYWGYDTDRYALALMLYQALSPEDDMTSRLATALIERQRRGTWGNTSSCYWAILAFGRVADSEARIGQDFSVKNTLGGVLLIDEGTASFGSYAGTPVSRTFAFTDNLLASMKRDTLLPLRLEKNGSGQLFYTASLRYGIPAELAKARDEGIGVFAETIDDEGNPVTDGKLTAGKTYTRRVVVSSSRTRTFLALRVPVPSGAEILDANFVTSASVPPDAENNERARDRGAEYNPWMWDDWRPVRFIMDDEARFHWDYFAQGRQVVEFRFRAVMPGVYPTPPANAECMYEGEVFGRSGGELIRIISSDDAEARQ
ncbi:alpha-2-macroglobulin family protein [Breznakiella homolactica]|uniref:Alpha-2-macroglobulin n=1 Tax=Breznakiella homolactica TaxID=2798577 RepID=A0A7T8BCR1_9SPIR|nr:alpha-2-macroglobulin family protein [Breznakiella homolactica]QQO10533.1 alpha-2-macroglobulin [Breznakiella homolactica]